MAAAMASRRFGSVHLQSAAPAKTEGIWKFLLSGAARTAEFEKSTFLILGKRDAGKAHLVRALQKIGAGGRKMNDMELFGEAGGVAGLDYAYMNVRAVDDADLTESLTTTDIWILQDVHHKDSLAEFVTPAHLQSLVVFICLDLSEPWTLREELKGWLTFATNFLEELRSKLSLEEQEALRSKLERYLNTYRKKVEGIPIDLDQQNQSQLTINLGVPFIVCVCKSDSAMSLDTRACPGRADAVLAHLRHLCYPYGAALIYCCTKDPMSSANLEKIYRYCLHRIYDFAFLEPPVWAPAPSIFIPAGWDTEEEIAAFASKTVGGGLETPLETLLPAPPQQPTDSTQGASKELAVPSIDAFLEGLAAADPSLLVKPSQQRPTAPIERQASDSATVRKPSRMETHDTGRVPSSRRHAEGAKGDAESIRAFFQTLLAKPPASARQTSPRDGRKAKEEGRKIRRTPSDSPTEDLLGGRRGVPRERRGSLLRAAVAENENRGIAPAAASGPSDVTDVAKIPAEQNVTRTAGEIDRPDCAPGGMERSNSGGEVSIERASTEKLPVEKPPTERSLVELPPTVPELSRHSAESTATDTPQRKGTDATGTPSLRDPFPSSIRSGEGDRSTSSIKAVRATFERPTAKADAPRSFQSRVPTSQAVRQPRDRSFEKLQSRSSMPTDAAIPRRKAEDSTSLRKLSRKTRPSEP